jgi:hypothetical protein
MFLDYFALVLLIFVALVIFYGIIVIHDIPYEIAKERNHPHQDAIHVSGWISLFTLHAIWPFLWIWATLWRTDRGWGFKNLEKEAIETHGRVDQLTAELNTLKAEVALLKATQNQPQQQTAKQEPAQSSSEGEA